MYFTRAVMCDYKVARIVKISVSWEIRIYK